MEFAFLLRNFCTLWNLTALPLARMRMRNRRTSNQKLPILFFTLRTMRVLCGIVNCTEWISLHTDWSCVGTTVQGEPMRTTNTHIHTHTPQSPFSARNARVTVYSYFWIWIKLELKMNKKNVAWRFPLNTNFCRTPRMLKHCPNFTVRIS